MDSVLVGPVPAGRHRFVFQANAPDTTKIPSEDVVGVTVVLLTCSYKSHEFVRVGYYVNNEYTDPEMAENLPAKAIFEKVRFNNYPLSLSFSLSLSLSLTHTHTHTHKDKHTYMY